MLVGSFLRQKTSFLYLHYERCAAPEHPCVASTGSTPPSIICGVTWTGVRAARVPVDRANQRSTFLRRPSDDLFALLTVRSRARNCACAVRKARRILGRGHERSKLLDGVPDVARLLD